jgi:hypothetical protein
LYFNNTALVESPMLSKKEKGTNLLLVLFHAWLDSLSRFLLLHCFQISAL